MKQIIGLMMVLVSSQAFATKARMTALNSSIHLVDTQSVYTSPYHIFEQDQFVALESGSTAASTTANGAEGSVMMKINDSSRMFISLGHLDESVQSQRKFINAVGSSTFKTQQNAVEAFYGQKTESMTWTAGAYFSRFNDKKNDESENTAGLRLGYVQGLFKAKLNLGLENKAHKYADATNTDLKGDTYMNLGLRYKAMDTVRLGFDYTSWGVKVNSLAGAEVQNHNYQEIKLTAVDVVSKDGSDFFYGLNVSQVDVKNKANDKKFTRTTLPVFVGMEVNANDWLVVRGSLSQTVFIANSKNEPGYSSSALTGATGTADAEYSPEAANTAANIGIGLKFGKLMVDGTLSGLSGSTANQNVDGSSLLTQVGAVYRF